MYKRSSAWSWFLIPKLIGKLSWMQSKLQRENSLIRRMSYAWCVGRIEDQTTGSTRPRKDLCCSMNNQKQFARLVEEVDFRLAHRRHLRERGVHLIVTHGDRIPGMLCMAGETIEDIAVAGQPQPQSLGLSHISLLLMDCLCRYRQPLTVRRIEQIMYTDPFYVQYAENRIGPNQCTAKPDRKSVRVYVPRIWTRMEKAFEESGLAIDPRQILLQGMTDSNVVTYRLKATVEVLHSAQSETHRSFPQRL